MVYKSSSIAAGGGSAGTGGGTISNITSTAGTITVGNSTGPTTNVDANLATSSAAGIVQPDNATITISGGVISAVTGGGGSVTNVSGVTANGFAFSIANPTTTPAITAKTTITGLLQGNGTAISAVPNGGISNVLLANSMITVGAGTGLTGGGSVALGGAVTLSLTSSSVTVSGVSGITGGGAVALGSSITLGVADSIANTLAGYNSSGVFSDVSIGSNLSLSGGVLNGTIGPAPVSSVFTRTGAVIAQAGDYGFSLISGTAAVSQGGTGAVSFTAHSVLLGEGASAVSAATTGTSGRLLIDQGAADPAFKILSGDSTLTSAGLMTNTAVNSVAYPASPSTNTVPVVTSSNQITYEQVPNAALANSSITVSGVSGVTGGGAVALGSSITLGMADSTANTLAGYNNSGVFSGVSIGSNLSLSGGILVATAGSGAVSSVFGRTGAVVANWNDYQFNLIGGTASASQGGTGLQTLTAHAVMLGEGVSAVSFATTGISGRLLLDQGSGSDPLFKVMSGDVGITSAGATSIISSVALTGNPTAVTQASGDNSTRIATDAFVTTAINNAIAGVNPAVAVQAATAAILPNSPTYLNGVSGVGATITAGVTNNTLVVDGYTPTLNQRILVKNEASGGGLGAADNGVYFLSTLATIGVAWVLTRALDYDQPSDINNTGAIPVVNGTANATTSWVITSTVNTVGTDALTYTQFSVAPSTIITNTTTAGGSLAGTYPNPTIAVGAISGGTSISINTSGSVTGITYTGSATGVSTITNSDGSLTISPQTGVAIASLNAAHANTWTATQTSAVSGGVASFISTGCIEFSIFANGNSGAGTPTLAWNNGNIQSVTITGACTLGFTAPTHPGRLTIIATQSATSGFAYAYAGTVLWPGGTKPTLSSISNAKDVSSFLYDGISFYGVANTGFA